MATRTLDEIMALSPVMPIVAIDDAGAAGELAEALAEGGVNVIEVTLRTKAALEAITEIRKAVPGMSVGAGTLLTPRDVGQAADAGAQFLVTPGVTTPLIEALNTMRLPCLPGVATPSEVASLMARGLTRMKFFPAEQAGGAAWLAAMAGPFPDVRFCPTGGITREAAPAYLNLSNVNCVGGSWVAPARAIEARDWPTVTENARAAMALRNAA